VNNHMMAAVLYGKEHLQVEPVAVPSIENGDILVRVKVALTCGTDVKVFRRGYHARMIVPRRCSVTNWREISWQSARTSGTSRSGSA